MSLPTEYWSDRRNGDPYPNPKVADFEDETKCFDDAEYGEITALYRKIRDTGHGVNPSESECEVIGIGSALRGYGGRDNPAIDVITGE